ncbi:glutamyl-tRNA synthetase, catalytic subunit [Legionella hackeliae]|nr:glutamyl-tRNA synthetase, catalytic subunit [Legionella hackeliae]
MQIQAERCKTLVEICEKSLYFYQDAIEYDEEAVKKHLRPVILSPLETLLQKFQGISLWEKDALQECINDVSAEFDMNMGKIAQPLRVAVTGSSMSPAIDMTLTLLGKERTLARLEQGLERIRLRAASAQ